MQTFYTPADIKTLRELCGLTRLDLARVAKVQEHSIKDWERPKAFVPPYLGDLLHKKLAEISELTSRLMALDAKVIALPRDSDMPNEFDEGFDNATWTQAVGRCVLIKLSTQVTWLLPEKYEAFLKSQNKSHCLAEMAHWAKNQVQELSAKFHANDQLIDSDCEP